MRPILIGTPGDARGFTLAGVESWVCDSRQAVDQKIDEVLQREADAVLIFSAAAYDLAADRCMQWRREGQGPTFVILPR